ncbi:MAG: esterase/lipase family protein, partial [Candidatus Methylomirabilaceae bacterium]
YGREDTYKSIEDSATLLSQQVKEIHRRYPDRKIDIVAHSQGGVVAQYYVEFLYDPDNTTGIRLDHLVTIGSPHGGDELARLGPQLSDDLAGKVTLLGLNRFANAAGLPPPGSPAAMQLATNSSFMRELHGAWDPTKVRATTIASAFDYVVTSDRTRLEGADTYTIATLSPEGMLAAHGDVVEAARPYVYNALANRRSPCTALLNKLADRGTAAFIAGNEALLIYLLDHLWIGSFVR